jgi:putative ABC transport system permease protein
VDPEFTNTFQIGLADGRFFSESMTTDRDAFVLNEAAIKAMGIDTPVGKWFEYPWINQRGPIIGVVRDFHFTSLHSKIEPLILLMRPDEYRFMCLRIGGKNIQETLSFIEETWKTVAPRFPFEFGFLDDEVDRLYSSENRLSRLILTFSVIAILISCLGLFGLVSFMIEQKTKEIGIRKVLGASVSGVIFIFIRKILIMVGMANFVAWPLTYYLMHQWLQYYPYRASLSLWIFMLSSIITLAITLTAVFVQVFKAATANPVEALRYE